MAKNDAILKAKGNQDRLGFDKQKHAQDMGLKKLELTSKLGGGAQGAMADTMLAKGQEKPRGVWDGVMNGILAVMGAHAKGKANEEMLAKINDTMEVYDYVNQAKQQAEEIKQNVAKQQDMWEASPSSQQLTSSIQDGSFEGTMKVAMKQMGIQDGSFSLSNDLNEVFIKDETGKVVDSQPITNFVSPEDSKKFKMFNDLHKAQLVASDNKQIKALAEENQRMKLERMYQKELGMSPEMASQMADNDIKDGIIEEIKLTNETKKANASEMRAKDEHLYAGDYAASKRAYTEDIKNRWDPEQNSAISLAKKQASNIADHVVSLKESNHRIDTALHEFSMLESLLKDPKREVITGDTVNSKRSRFWAGLTGNKALSDTELYDAFEKGFFAHFKGDVKFGNMNREQFALEMDQMPHSKFTKQGMLDIIDMQRQKLTAQKARNDEEIKIVPNYTSRLNERYEGQSTSGQPAQGAGQGADGKGGGKQNGLWMTTPSNTRIWIPSKQVKQAYADGLVDE